MEYQDYYQLLGVARDADQEAIKQAYRKLALRWHPDRHEEKERAHAEAEFKKISEAYAVLSDPEKRARYDQLGRGWQQGQDFTPPPGARTMSRDEFEQMFGGASGFSDFFARMFGDQVPPGADGARTHARFRHRGSDVRAELALDLGDAIAGGTRDFVVPGSAACERCGGVGFLDDAVCPACAGVGTTHIERQVSLKIPADLHDGQTLRLRGLGQSGAQGGEAGDLYLTLRLRSDAVYRIVGERDVEADVPIAPWEALAGTTVEVATARAVASARIPPNTRAGARLRLRGQGLADARGERGDFYIVVRIALPDDLTPRQRELIAELGRSGAHHVAGGARRAEAG